MFRTRKSARTLLDLTRLATFLVAYVTVLPAPALAQCGAPAGTDFLQGSVWFAATVGGAGARLTCDLCQPARDLGPSVNVSIGAYASPRVRVGLEGGGWTHDEEDIRERVYRAGVVAHLLPDPARGLYLLGGFGWSGYRAESFRYDAARLTLGVGWDLPLTSRWMVGNSITLDAASFGTLKNDEATVARNVGLSLVRLSVGIRRR